MKRPRCNYRDACDFKLAIKGVDTRSLFAGFSPNCISDRHTKFLKLLVELTSRRRFVFPNAPNFFTNCWYSTRRISPVHTVSRAIFFSLAHSRPTAAMLAPAG